MARIDEAGTIEFAVRMRLGTEMKAWRGIEDIESICALADGTGTDLDESCGDVSGISSTDMECLFQLTIRTDGRIDFVHCISGVFRTRSFKGVAILNNP